MCKFKEAFDAYGANYTATMDRFMGNETLYLHFLDMLFEDENLKKLGDALKTGDMASAFEAAHTLKGAVGNMGLTPLYRAVSSLVEPLRAHERREDYQLLYQVLQMEFQRADQLRKELRIER